jgi:DNA-binding transcriptional regulator YdaS (Cro superfamily)
MSENHNIVPRHSAKHGKMHTTQSHLREKIQAGIAVTKLNQALAGEITLSATHFAAIKLALGKVLPDLQAVAVAIEHNMPTSQEDMNAKLTQAGINPAIAWAMLNNESIDGEAVIVDQDDQGDQEPQPTTEDKAG